MKGVVMKKLAIKKPVPRVEKVCSYRLRDVQTGRLLPNPASKSEYLYTRDGLKVHVRYGLDDLGELEALKIVNVSGFSRNFFKNVPTREKAGFLRNLKASILEELQREHDLDRFRRVSTADLNRERGQKSAATKKQKEGARVKSGLPAKAVVDRARASSEAQAVKARVLALTIKINRSRSAKITETLKKRKQKLERARVQLEKIAKGKASKFPTPSQLR
jgi:hypothetical protein